MKYYSLFDGPARPFCDLDEILRSCPNPTPLPESFNYPFPGMITRERWLSDHYQQEPAVDQKICASEDEPLCAEGFFVIPVSKETEIKVEKMEETDETGWLFIDGKVESVVRAPKEDFDVRLKLESTKEGKHEKKHGNGRSKCLAKAKKQLRRHANFIKNHISRLFRLLQHSIAPAHGKTTEDAFCC